MRVLSSRLAPEDVDDVIAQAPAAVTEGASPLQSVTGGGNRPEDLADRCDATTDAAACVRRPVTRFQRP